MNVDLHPGELDALYSATFSHQKVVTNMIGAANDSMLGDVIGVLAAQSKDLLTARAKIEKAMREQKQ